MILLPLPPNVPTGGALLRWRARIYAGGTPSKDEASYWDDGQIPWLA